MKRLMIRVSSLLKGFVLALILSVFLQASLASANGDLISLNQGNFYTSITTDINGDEGGSFGLDYTLIENIDVSGIESITTVFTTFSGTLDGNEFTISGLTKPLFGELIGDISNLNLTSAAGVTGNGALTNVQYAASTIDNVSFTGDITGTDDVGGLVGISSGAITNSFATGVVTGTNYVGGLVGSQESGAITNSSANGAVDGTYAVGGLVGRSRSEITNSFANSAVDGTSAVGGLVGESTSTSTITNNSYATGTVVGTEYAAGGLVGNLAGAITNSFAEVTVTGSNNVGGLVGESTLTSTITNNSYATGTVTGTDSVGGLAGYSYGTIDNSYATGTVTGNDNVGGLVGVSEGDITNSSYATGDVTGSGEYIGGLVGWLEVGATISNSYAKTGTVTGIGTDEGDHGIGGLVGYSSGSISGSYAEGNVNGFEQVGGLVGSTGDATEITDSYATGTVTGSGDDVGGLVGLLDSGHTITNSYAAGAVEGTNDVGGLVGYSAGTITNSYATGEVRGTGTNNDMNLTDDYSDVGGLVGENAPYAFITDSFATGNVTGALVYTGRLVGYSDYYSEISDSFGYGEANIDGTPIEVDPYLGEGEAPNILTIVNGDGFFPVFGENASINGGRPFLISLLDSYDVVEEDTEETPSYSLRSYYTQAANSLDKALISFGFKSNFSSHPNLGFQALEQNQSKLPAVIQLFEVSDYQNSNIILNKEDGLQLSISSYYKEPVEIWTQGLNGEYLYLGLVEFDKDGKAILPTLKFDTANTYQLLMIKAADKLSQKPNLEAKVGQININVF